MKFEERAASIFKKTETSVICAVLAALMLAYYLYSTSSHNAYPEAAYGKPAVSTEYPQMDISMEQVVEAGQYLYVLHHHSNGIVQVYDLGGTYLHTLFFYCHGKGGFFLAFLTFENKLWLCLKYALKHLLSKSAAIDK